VLFALCIGRQDEGGAGLHSCFGKKKAVACCGAKRGAITAATSYKLLSAFYEAFKRRCSVGRGGGRASPDSGGGKVDGLFWKRGGQGVGHQGFAAPLLLSFENCTETRRSRALLALCESAASKAASMPPMVAFLFKAVA